MALSTIPSEFGANLSTLYRCCMPLSSRYCSHSGVLRVFVYWLAVILVQVIRGLAVQHLLFPPVGCLNGLVQILIPRIGIQIFLGKPPSNVSLDSRYGIVHHS